MEVISVSSFFRLEFVRQLPLLHIIDNFEEKFIIKSNSSDIQGDGKIENHITIMIKIGEFKQGTEHEVSRLISDIFDEFVAPDYTEGGVRFFKDFIRPEKFMERIMKGDFILVATDEDTIVGMIEVRDNDHISLLFVDKKYQRRLIAKNLFQEALKRCRSVDPELSMFYVHASPYSIPAYHKIGFAAIGGMQEANGIFYLPMAMTLQSWPAGI